MFKDALEIKRTIRKLKGRLRTIKNGHRLLGYASEHLRMQGGRCSEKMETEWSGDKHVIFSVYISDSYLLVN
jgi:hypothetical protein